MSGFIPIGRELQNHWLRRDKDYWMVFCEMFFLARYSDKPETRNIDGLEVTIHQKEFIFGRPGWSRRLDISEQRLKTLIKKLIDEGFIKQTQRHSKFTVYSFEYEPEIIQMSNQQNNQHSNQQKFSEQPAETQLGQGLSGTSNQQKFSEQPAQQPAEQPMKEEGIKEEGYKGEGFNNMAKNQFDQFYEIYPRKVAKAYAEKVWEKLSKDKEFSPEVVIQNTANFAETHKLLQTDKKHIPHPSTYLNQKRYEDYEVVDPERLLQITKPNSKGGGGNPLDRLLRKELEADGSHRRDITDEVHRGGLPELPDGR
ncbi:hypothetical protein NYE54_08335 [Paenibacillus sp. FSL K6-1330]|uniref:hypothetical protein n=1 Tax=Paenibacillus sp. FSL K6-1330 TaxID=2975292 RepID=UPI0030D726F7